MIIVDYSEEQPHSYKETCNSIRFDGVQSCDCECHSIGGILHFEAYCQSGKENSMAPYDGIYCTAPKRYIKKKKRI